MIDVPSYLFLTIIGVITEIIPAHPRAELGLKVLPEILDGASEDILRPLILLETDLVEARMDPYFYPLSYLEALVSQQLLFVVLVHLFSILRPVSGHASLACCP